MLIEVQLFAGARQLAGRATITIEIAAGATIADLKLAVAEVIPALAPLLGSTRFAINQEYVEDDQIIPPGAEVAAIPPVSGGEEAAS